MHGPSNVITWALNSSKYSSALEKMEQVEERWRIPARWHDLQHLVEVLEIVFSPASVPDFLGLRCSKVLSQVTIVACERPSART